MRPARSVISLDHVLIPSIWDSILSCISVIEKVSSSSDNNFNSSNEVERFERAFLILSLSVPTVSEYSINAFLTSL